MNIIAIIIACIINIIIYLFVLKMLAPKEMELTLDQQTNTLYCNGDKLISFRVGSGNYRLMNYLFSHANKKITLAALKKNVFGEQQITINRILSNTKLPKEIIDTFFCLSQDSFVFKNKVVIKPFKSVRKN